MCVVGLLFIFFNLRNNTMTLGSLTVRPHESRKRFDRYHMTDLNGNLTKQNDSYFFIFALKSHEILQIFLIKFHVFMNLRFGT